MSMMCCIVATAALFGLWFGLAHVEIPQYFQMGLDVVGYNINIETDGLSLSRAVQLFATI